MPEARPRRLVVAITGATGAVYGVRLLQQLAATPGIETHLIISDAANLTLHQEVGMQRRDVEALAHVVHKNRDVGASIASGSTAVTEMGGIIFAPLPSFYHRPASIEEMVDHTVARVIDLFGVEHALAPRWAGMKPPADA